MKKNKGGFTLIELLGVVVILAVVIGLVFPNVINMIKKSNSEMDANTKKLIYNAADLTLKENKETFPNDEVTAYCLTMKDLIDYGYLIDNVKINKDNIKDTKAVLAIPDVIENKENYDLYSNGFGYQIVEKEECDEYAIVPGIKKCLTDKKCHICNKLSDLKTWGYITENVILDGVDITNTHSYDFGDSSLGISSGYITNEECENSKIYIAYKGLPNFSKSKAKSLGITYTSTGDYYSIDSNNTFREQVRKSSLLKRNFSKDEFSDLIITNNVEYTLNDKILTINKSKLLYDTEIKVAYKVCLNGTSDCTKVEKNTSYTLNNLPTHNALLINGEYKYDESNDSYTISDVNKDYIVYTKTLYNVKYTGEFTDVTKLNDFWYDPTLNKDLKIQLPNPNETAYTHVQVAIGASSVTYPKVTESPYELIVAKSEIVGNVIVDGQIWYNVNYKNFTPKYLNSIDSTLQSPIIVKKGSKLESYLNTNFTKYDIYMDGSKITDYTLSNNKLILPSSSTGVTGDIDIYAKGTIHYTNYPNISDEYVVLNQNYAKDLSSYAYDSVKIKVGNKKLKEGTDYTFNNKQLVINKNTITDNVEITGYNWEEIPLNNNLIPIRYVKDNSNDYLMYSSSYTNIQMNNQNMCTTSTYKYGHWEVADSSNANNNWYNYGNQKWANAVLVSNSSISKYFDGTSYKVGTSITEADVIGYFVWIPQFEFKVENNQVIANIITSKNYTTTNGYTIHPAFTFEGTNINGFWSAKFLGDSKPNQSITSSIGNTISSYLNYDTNNNLADAYIDSHAMKLSEYSAITYLSQSNYGKYGNNHYTDDNKNVYTNVTNQTGKSSGGLNSKATGSTTAIQYNDDHRELATECYSKNPTNPTLTNVNMTCDDKNCFLGGGQSEATILPNYENGTLASLPDYYTTSYLNGNTVHVSSNTGTSTSILSFDFYVNGYSSFYFKSWYHTNENDKNTNYYFKLTNIDTNQNAFCITNKTSLYPGCTEYYMNNGIIGNSQGDPVTIYFSKGNYHFEYYWHRERTQSGCGCYRTGKVSGITTKWKTVSKSKCSESGCGDPGVLYTFSSVKNEYYSSQSDIRGITVTDLGYGDRVITDEVNGVGASTTGNVYGVYDMGMSQQLSAAVYSNSYSKSASKSNIGVSSIDSKYYDLIDKSNNTCNDGSCTGYITDYAVGVDGSKKYLGTFINNTDTSLYSVGGTDNITNLRLILAPDR